MKLIFSIILLHILFSSNDLKAQNTSISDSIHLINAENKFASYEEKAFAFREQLTSIDSTYKAAEVLFNENEEKYKRAKNAFKSLEVNYKAQLLPYKKEAKSRDRIKASEAKKMIVLIKLRFQENGKEAANFANNANREMIRAQKIMERAKSRAEHLIPRLDKTLIEMDKWATIIAELKAEKHN